MRKALLYMSLQVTRLLNLTLPQKTEGNILSNTSKKSSTSIRVTTCQAKMFISERNDRTKETIQGLALPNKIFI